MEHASGRSGEMGKGEVRQLRWVAGTWSDGRRDGENVRCLSGIWEPAADNSGGEYDPGMNEKPPADAPLKPKRLRKQADDGDEDSESRRIKEVSSSGEAA
jgi:hypothetical protein